MKERANFSLYIAELIGNYLKGIDKQPSKELEEWLNASVANKKLFEDLVKGKNLSSLLDSYDLIDLNIEWEALRKKLKTRKLRINTRWIWASSIAASLLICCFWLFFLMDKNDSSNYTPFIGEKIMPGKTMAILSTSGKNIILGTNAKVCVQDGVSVIDSVGNKIFEDKSLDIKTCQLYVPKGGEYHIVLEDGTRVWLNSDTKLVFPEHFSKDKREISISGEAYLEVAHNSEKPFFVQTGESQIHVTGTMFNVRNYADEKKTSVALVQGRVQMENERNGKVLAVLSPSNEFTANNKTGTYSVSSVNLDYVLAWKNGIFAFEDESLPSIAKKLERWYNIKIEIDPSLTRNHYSGYINKYKSIDWVVDILQRTQELRFVTDANGTIRIIPA